MGRPSTKVTEETTTQVVESPLKQIIPKPTQGGIPNATIIAKKIRAQRDLIDRDRKRRGETIVFQVTTGNTQIYNLKGEGVINIPEDWKDYSDMRDYLKRALGGNVENVPTGEQEVRLIRGEKTIFRSLQSDSALRKIAEPITFTSGVRGEPCHIIINNKKNPNEYAYLMLSNRCYDNPFRTGGSSAYKVISEAQTTKETLNKSLKEFSALEWITHRDEVELMAAASVLGLDTYDGDTMRAALIQSAKSNPEQFLNIVNDDLLAVKSTYMLAKQIGVLTRDGNLVKWKGTGGVIQVIPSGKTADELDIMANFLTSEEGSSTYDAIIRLLND